MSKKTLLNETQVRRFMKLANMGTLSDGFVDGLSEGGYFDTVTTEQEEEELGDDLGAEEPAMELGGDDELPVDDMALDDEEGLGDDPALDDAAGESLPPEVVSKVEDALAAALGAMEQELEEAIPELDLSVEQEDEAELGGEGDLEAELGGEEELPGDEGPEAELGGLGGEEELGPEAPAEDELVERIVRRVAERLRTRKGNK